MSPSANQSHTSSAAKIQEIAMQFYWEYAGCDMSEQMEIASAFRSRQAELEAKVELVGGDQTTPVVISVEHLSGTPAWAMRAALYSPRGTAATEIRAEDWKSAIDQLIGELSQQIDQQADQPIVVRTRRSGLSSFVPFLQSFHHQGMSREFISVLTPLLNSLSHYTMRELRTRRALGEMSAGQTSLQDVNGEVLVKAWERFPKRSASQPLDAWLIGLIEESLDALTQPVGERSLQEREPAISNEPRESLKFESLEHAAETETLALASLLESRSDVGPWDQLNVEDRQVRLDHLLRNLPRSQRHALMLSAVEGFSHDEIADLQNRSLSEVANDLTAATEEVRRMFTEPDYLDIEETLAREALERPRRSHRS